MVLFVSAYYVPNTTLDERGHVAKPHRQGPCPLAVPIPMGETYHKQKI